MLEIAVSCLVNRAWDPFTMMYTGDEKQGVLLHFLTGYQEGTAVPAGVVCFSDNTFEAVPLEFITKT